MNPAEIALTVKMLLGSDARKVVNVLGAREQVSCTRRRNGFKRGTFSEILVSYGPLSAKQRRRFVKDGVQVYYED